jgi:aconitate hydratase
MKKPSVELAVAYESRCIATGAPPDDAREIQAELLAQGLVVVRPGAGFAPTVHLERFASPGRLCITDEPRLAAVGGIGMLTFVVPTDSLANALARGRAVVRRPVSVQVVLTGRLRPFVCARDVGLELVRRGLGQVIRRAEEVRGAPVVLEFAGPSVRLLSIGERSVLAAMAPHLGAAASLFASDERTEVFLRDQRRSKAHRTLVPDAGAPWEDVVSVDLGAVDPLLLDREGHVRAVRDLAGQPVSQVLLGGDSGATLRDFLAAAALLKSKRVPLALDFLLAVPSRQTLEVLAATGALSDLIATGARLIEPDARVTSGELYVPPSTGVALCCSDPEPRLADSSPRIVTSAETMAYAVASGQVGDPRGFKRPVRVTVPRILPTEDVLLGRKADRRGTVRLPRTPSRSNGELAAPPAWKEAQTLRLVEGARLPELGKTSNGGHAGIAVLCATLEEVRDLSARAHDICRQVRAVLAPYIPSALVGLLSAAGIVAIRLDSADAIGLRGEQTIALPPPSDFPERGAATIAVGARALPLTWLALGPERSWATGTRAYGA